MRLQGHCVQRCTRFGGKRAGAAGSCVPPFRAYFWRTRVFFYCKSAMVTEYALELRGSCGGQDGAAQETSGCRLGRAELRRPVTAVSADPRAEPFLKKP